MTDEPDDVIDELLSADLDGETTPAEHEWIGTEPGLRSRQGELQQAAQLAGRQPTPLEPASVDAVIDRALTELSPDDTGRAGSTPASVRRPRSRRLPSPLLVAAAVVLLAAIGIGLIVTAPSKQRSDTANREASGGETKSASPHDLTSRPATTTSSSAQSGAAATARPATVGSLGNFASLDALRSALRTRLPATRPLADVPTRDRASTGQADRCATVVEARDPRLLRSNRQAAVTASVGREQLLVLEYRASALQQKGLTTRIVVVGIAACDDRINFER